MVLKAPVICLRAEYVIDFDFGDNGVWCITIIG